MTVVEGSAREACATDRPNSSEYKARGYRHGAFIFPLVTQVSERETKRYASKGETAGRKR